MINLVTIQDLILVKWSYCGVVAVFLLMLSGVMLFKLIFLDVSGVGNKWDWFWLKEKISLK